MLVCSAFSARGRIEFRTVATSAVQPSSVGRAQARLHSASSRKLTFSRRGLRPEDGLGTAWVEEKSEAGIVTNSKINDSLPEFIEDGLKIPSLVTTSGSVGSSDSVPASDDDGLGGPWVEGKAEADIMLNGRMNAPVSELEGDRLGAPRVEERTQARITIAGNISDSLVVADSDGPRAPKVEENIPSGSVTAGRVTTATINGSLSMDSDNAITPLPERTGVWTAGRRNPQGADCEYHFMAMHWKRQRKTANEMKHGVESR